MKSTILVPMVLILAASGAMAQSFGQSGSGGSVFAPCTLGPDDITQSLDCDLVAGTAIACTGGGVSTDNQHLRRFFLNEDHGIVEPYEVDAVEFGVESAISSPRNSACPGNPVTVNCYSLRDDREMLYSNMTLLDSTSTNLHRTEDLSFVTVRMNGSCKIGDPVRQNLVIEISTCDHNDVGAGGTLMPGTNDLGETRSSYIAAPDCQIVEPDTLDALGFPDSDYVWIIQGRERNVPQTGSFVGKPSALRSASGIEVTFRIELTHLAGGGDVQAYVELQDLKGNLLASRDLGILGLVAAEPSRVSDVLRAPSAVTAGTYVLVGKVPTAGRMVQFKKLIQVP